MRSFLSVLTLLTMTNMVSGQGADSGLKVDKVVLYKSGVGYFQHRGTVVGNDSIEIPLPSSQLDDVLKSLTVLDLGGGQVGEVTYDSVAPLNRRLEELAVDLRSAANLVDFLRQIKGATVSVNMPSGQVTGRLLGAEVRVRQDQAGASVQSVELALFVEPGEVKIVPLDSVGALRIEDEALSSDVSRYLELLGSENRRDLRRLRIQLKGSGERPVFVSYTAETPIWKTSYRVVLRDGGRALLQGWAVVDNTTPLDWQSVQLSLVSGAPISFKHPLSEPVYASRPEIPIMKGPAPTPQIHTGTLIPAEEEMPEQEGRRLARKLQLGAKSPAAAAGVDLMQAEFFDQILSDSVESAAEGHVLGEQFEYRLKDTVTIGQNQSAMLPIVQGELSAEKVSVFNEQSDSRRPRLALWLTNDSGQTLDGGVFSVLEMEAFAGEGLFETIQPNERRLLSYAVDLGVEVSTRLGSERLHIQRASFHRGVLKIVRQLVQKRTYTIRNNAEQPRAVLIEHPIQQGWQLMEGTKAEDTSRSLYRFRVPVDGQTSETYAVALETPAEETYQISSLTPEQIELWIKDRSLGNQVREPLSSIRDKKNQVAGLTGQVNELKKQEDEVFRDQQRIRDNLGRLGRNPEEASLRQRYIDQLSRQEDSLKTIREERRRLETELVAAQKSLEKLIESLELDWAL